MKGGSFSLPILLLLTIIISLIVNSSSVFSQSSYLMEKGYVYSANFPAGSVFDVNSIVENAKATGFWIRLGPRNVTIVDGKKILPEYKYYHGEDLLDCPPSDPGQCMGYPLLYAYPDDEAFAIVVESENYTMQVSPAGPGSRLSPAEYGIHILPKRNITREYSEDEVNKYLLSLGILKTYAQLSFSRGLRLGGFSPFGEAPEIDYQPDFFETISYYAIPHTGNPDLDHFISYYGPYIILIAVASALFVAAFRLIRRGGSR